MKRNTAQKTAVLQALGRLGHATVAELHREAARTCPGLGLATVYRLLSEGTREGTVRCLSFPGAEDRFDLTLSPHAHILCRRCGRVCDLEEPEIPAALLARAAGLGYAVEGYGTSLVGLCADCAGQDRAPGTADPSGEP